MEQTKLCGNCNTVKPLSDFYPLKRGGVHSQCKVCSKARYQAWRLKNAKRHAERNNKWFHENRESVLSQQRLYRAATCEVRKARRVGEHYKRKQHNCKRAIQWAKANPQRRRALEHRREARKRSLPDTWTVAEMEAALLYWGNACPVCGIGMNGKRHWDHWIPLVSKQCPGTVAANMIPLCQRCNTRKNDSMPLPWLKRTFPTMWQQIMDRIAAYLSSLKPKP